MEYNIKHEKLLTKRLKSSTIVNCNENKKLIEVINKMKDNKVYLTDEGFLELEEELNELKNVKRPEVIKALKEARALGDLSENADYDAARAEQAQVEGRIQELENIIEKLSKTTDSKICASLDKEFHYVIAKASKNHLLSTIVFSVSSLIEEYIDESKMYEIDREKVINDHKIILEAIISHDSKKAFIEAKNHLN